MERSEIARVEAIAKAYAAKMPSSLAPPTQSATMRAIVAAGLRTVEAELGIAPAQTSLLG